MRRFSASRAIASPPSEVFALVADPARILALRSELSVEHVGGAEGGVGATYRVRDPSARSGQVVTIEEHDPGERVAYRWETGYGVTWEVVAGDGGTLLTCTREHGPEDGLMGRAAKRLLDDEYVVSLVEEDLAAVDVALRADPSACRSSIEIPLPPSAVFAFVADPANVARWMSGKGGTIEVRHRSGPRVGLDAAYDFERRDSSGPAETHELTIVEYEPDLLVTHRLEGWSDAVFTIAPVEAGSLLTETRRPVPKPRGIRQRLRARMTFDPARVVPEIEWNLGRIRDAIAG